MRWHILLLVLSALGFTTLVTGFRTSFQLPESSIDSDLLTNEDNNVEDESAPSLSTYDDEVIEKIGDLLTELLILPWPKGISPLLYVENSPPGQEEKENDLELDQYQNLYSTPAKRTRYYRKYPWKRQNSRYEPGNRFLCTPSKDDVYRLLVALHEARQGNRDRVVNFCNRKRPAYAVFTNIRFLG